MMATTTLFYGYEWPRNALAYITRSSNFTLQTGIPNSASATDDVDHIVGCHDDGDKTAGMKPEASTPCKVARCLKQCQLSL